MVTLAGLGISEEEALEDLRNSKEKLIQELLDKKANEVKRAAEMQHIPGQPVKMGGPGSRKEDWELDYMDHAYIDKQFPALIKESPWYYDGIYKDNALFPELDKILYGDEDAFMEEGEFEILIKAGVAKYDCIITKDVIREWKKKYRDLVKGKWNIPEELTNIKDIDNFLKDVLLITRYDDMKKIGENGPWHPKSYYEQQEKELQDLFESFKNATNPSPKRNWSYTIKEGEHEGKTLWSGRYCAVTGIVYCKVYFPKAYNNDICDIYILIEKRGEKTPDFQGKWCLPCGFLEGDEWGASGINREVYEETGIEPGAKNFKLFGVQTNPFKSNKGHVTLRYAAEVDYMYEPDFAFVDPGEVADVRWININQISKYDWAFNHDELIKDFFSTQDYEIRDFLKKTDVELFD